MTEATLYKLPEYAQHPIAASLMPGGMSDDEFKAFCDDIAERGVLMPIWLYDNKVLDGWHRYRAAKKTGGRPDFKEYTGKDPAGFVASCNIHRRKLSSLQRALVGARLHKDYALTQRQVCAKLGISNEVLSLAVKALESKNTTIIKRIEADADFSRSMLREELTDAGLLRAKPDEVVKPETLVNSVFDMATKAKPLTGKEGTITYNYDAAFMPADGAPPADDDDDDVDDLLDTPASLEAEKKKARKPRETAVQAAVDVFKALREEEQQRFITAVWPLARGLAKLDTVWAGNLLPLVAVAAPAASPAKPAAKPASRPAKPANGRQATPLVGKPAKPASRPASPAAAPAKKATKKRK
jgi:ParB-like chromosome segregation protein Spo0J